MIKNLALPRLLQILTSNYDNCIKQEVCGVISNIAAGNSNQIQVLQLIVV